MKKSTRNRRIISVIMIIAAVGLGVALGGSFTGPDSALWQRAVFLLAVAGTGISGLFGLLGLKWYYLGYAYIAAIAVPMMLPQPWRGLLMVAAIGGLLLWNAGSAARKKFAEQSAGQNAEPALQETPEQPEAEKLTEQQSAAEQPAPNAGHHKVLKVVRTCLYVYLALVNLPWMFMEVPYKLFSALSLLALPVTLVLYLCFPNELTLGKVKDDKSRLSIATAVLFAGMLPALRSLLDFNLLGLGRALLFSGILFALVTGVVLLCSKELRRGKTALFTMILVLAFYSFAAVTQLNFDLDTSTPRVEQAEIIRKSTTHTAKTPTRFRLRLELENGDKLSVTVGMEKYMSVEEGDSVDVYYYDGALDIPYVFAN